MVFAVETQLSRGIRAKDAWEVVLHSLMLAPGSGLGKPYHETARSSRPLLLLDDVHLISHRLQDIVDHLTKTSSRGVSQAVASSIME